MELEIKEQDNKTTVIRGGTASIMMAPIVDDSYWKYRVKLYKDQAVIGFPKFCTIGVGFAKEEDWNTNLPYTCSAEEICKHIWHNKKYSNITKEQVIEAITLIQMQAQKDEGKKLW
jgi:hypothetical protein